MGVLNRIGFSSSSHTRVHCFWRGGRTPTPQTSKPLEIYFVDVEGGQATLFVTPEGQSLLIDTGWPDFDGRDADRIVAAAKKAGLSKIDFVMITHYHRDHVGGVPQLAARIPIGAFIDHGPNRETSDPATEEGWQAYQKVLTDKKIKRTTAKAGDVLPISGIRVEIVSADGVLLAKPLSGAGAQNPICSTAREKTGRPIGKCALARRGHDVRKNSNY